MEIVNYENINLREEGSNLSATNQIACALYNLIFWDHQQQSCKTNP